MSLLNTKQARGALHTQDRPRDFSLIGIEPPDPPPGQPLCLVDELPTVPPVENSLRIKFSTHLVSATEQVEEAMRILDEELSDREDLVPLSGKLETLIRYLNMYQYNANEYMKG